MEQLAQRKGDLALGHDAGRALVQQRREQVVLSPVDEGHLDRRVPQRPGGEQPGEPAADDHYLTGAGCLGHGSPRPFIASYRLRAFIAMVIARKPPNIAPMWVLPGPGRCRLAVLSESRPLTLGTHDVPSFRRCNHVVAAM